MRNGVKNLIDSSMRLAKAIILSRFKFWVGLVLIVCANAEAQNSKPAGIFITDSADIGKPIYFSLSVRHKPTTEIFFPDSLGDYSPFEFVEKRIFTSKTTNNITLDSAVYKLVSFSIEPFQYLKLPVYIFNKKDCTAYFSLNDTLFLKSENLQIQKNQKKFIPSTQLVALDDEFNVSVLLAILAMLISLSTAIYWIFGEDIYKQWQLLKLQRRHIEYLRSFNRLLRNSREKGSIKDAEKAIIIWKNYLEKLEKRPFATFTTREIIDSMPDPELAEALKNLDGMIYGQVKSNKMHGFLEVLKQGGTRMYKNRRKQILERQKS